MVRNVPTMATYVDGYIVKNERDVLHRVGTYQFNNHWGSRRWPMRGKSIALARFRLSQLSV